MRKRSSIVVEEMPPYCRCKTSCSSAGRNLFTSFQLVSTLMDLGRREEARRGKNSKPFSTDFHADWFGLAQEEARKAEKRQEEARNFTPFQQFPADWFGLARRGKKSREEARRVLEQQEEVLTEPNTVVWTGLNRFLPASIKSSDP